MSQLLSSFTGKFFLLILIDFCLKTRYDMFMETLYLQTVDTIGSWIGAFSGKSINLRLSKKAMLASSDFLLENSETMAENLSKECKNCLFKSASLIRSIRAENGWLLIDLNKSYFDAFSLLLPDSFEYGSAYVDKRMEMFLRHGDAPLPDYDPVLKAILIASFASTRGKWTQDDERTVLTMTHALSGMERVRTEHALARAAKIILYERRSLK